MNNEEKILSLLEKMDTRQTQSEQILAQLTSDTVSYTHLDFISLCIWCNFSAVRGSSLFTSASASLLVRMRGIYALSSITPIPPLSILRPCRKAAARHPRPCRLLWHAPLSRERNEALPHARRLSLRDHAVFF